jgi:hypothetical protein
MGRVAERGRTEKIDVVGQSKFKQYKNFFARIAQLTESYIEAVTLLRQQSDGLLMMH